MLRFLILLLVTFTTTLPATDTPREKSATIEVGSVIPQIVQGGAWSTELQVVNTDDEGLPVPYIISFYKDGGLNMAVHVLDGNGISLGTQTTISNIVSYLGVDFYTLPHGGQTNIGYAVITAAGFNTVMVNAVLTQRVPGRPDFQASAPSLRSFMDTMRIPFKNTRPYTTSLAIADYFLGGVVTIIARDTTGAELCRTSFEMEQGDHRAIILSDALSCTAGRAGLIEINAQHGVAAIAFLFHDFGAFTTQLPFEVCCIF